MPDDPFSPRSPTECPGVVRRSSFVVRDARGFPLPGLTMDDVHYALRDYSTLGRPTAPSPAPGGLTKSERGPNQRGGAPGPADGAAAGRSHSRFLDPEAADAVARLCASVNERVRKLYGYRNSDLEKLLRRHAFDSHFVEEGAAAGSSAGGGGGLDGGFCPVDFQHALSRELRLPSETLSLGAIKEIWRFLGAKTAVSRARKVADFDLADWRK